MSAVALHLDGDGLVADDYPLVPPGEYLVCYVDHRTLSAFKQPKVYVTFRVVDGRHTGTKLFRAFRVKALVGKPRRNGRFVIRRTHELYRQFVCVTDANDRPDRIALTRLRNCVLRVSVRTVTQDSRQRDLAPDAHYSVVDRLLAIEAGSSK